MNDKKKAKERPSEEAPPSLTWSGARTAGGTDEQLVGRERPGLIGEEDRKEQECPKVEE